MEETKHYAHRSTSTQGNGTSELWHTIPYDFQGNDARNISVAYTYTGKRRSLRRTGSDLTQKPILIVKNTRRLSQAKLS